MNSLCCLKSRASSIFIFQSRVGRQCIQRGYTGVHVIERGYTGVHVIEEIKISPHLNLRIAESTKQIPSTQPLVLFFPWLNAPRKALDKYCDLYHSKGWNVLCIKGKLKHFLWPRSAKVVLDELFDFLSKEYKERENNPLVIHSMSVGAYLYTVMLMEMNQGKDPLHSAIRNSIAAQIFDSIVIGDLQRMGEGIAISRSKNSCVRGTVKAGVSTYLALTRPFTVKFYDEAVDTFKNAPKQGPVLFYYSEDDPMSSPIAMKQLIQQWENDPDMRVFVQSWKHSKHAGHLREHRQEYCAKFDHFLDEALD